MTIVPMSLQVALRAIATRWPALAATSAFQAAGANDADGDVWAAVDLGDVLLAGDVEPLLAWTERVGCEARARQVTPARFSDGMCALAAVICRLAAEALDQAESADLLHSIGAPVQAAALAGYLGADGATPIVRQPPRGGAGDLAGRLEKMEALHRINRAANSSLQLTAMLDQVVEAVADVIRSDTCSVWIYEEDTHDLVLRSARGLNASAIDVERLRLGQAITGEVARTRKPIAACNAPTHPAYEYVAALGEGCYRSQVSVPIVRYSADRLVGVMTLKTLKSHEFTNDEIRFLTTVTHELAIAIENAQLYQLTDARLREKVRELTTLQRVSARMAETLDMGEVLDIIVSNAAELGDARRATIFRLDREQGELVTLVSRGEEGDLPADEATVEREVMYEVVFRANLPTPSQGPSLVGLTSAQRPVGRDFSIYGLPLRSLRGVLGGICLHYRDAGGPTDEQYQLLEAFANAATIAIENAQLYADAQRNLVISGTLLQEMHHRVRNNLGQTAALLKMQQRRIAEPSAAAALGQSVARIHSIAAIHDLLSRNVVGVTTASDVAKRVADEAVSLLPSGGHYRLHVEGGGPEISGEQATSLAVVITEVLSNALRHGFLGRDDGDIWVRSWVEGPSVVMQIEDNGRGLPPGFAPERERGLGLSLVRTLAQKDLGGRLEMSNRPQGGARSTITFPYRPRPQHGGQSQGALVDSP